MEILFNRYLHRILLHLLLGLPLIAMAVTPGTIMDNSEAGQADATLLAAEAGIFKFIGMGIALSIAQCEGQATCTTVDENELQQLLQTLDSRINDLRLRQQENQEDLGEIIAAYSDERENYSRYMDKLGAIGMQDFAEEEITVEDAIDTARERLSEDELKEAEKLKSEFIEKYGPKEEESKNIGTEQN